jgi:hypothetical protein
MGRHRVFNGQLQRHCLWNSGCKKTNMIAFITRSRDRNVVVSMDCYVSESA